MTTPQKTNEHPSGDDRYKAIDRTVKRFSNEKDALLEVLNTAQETFGYLSEDLLIYVARQLSVPLSRVYGVATFYHMFTFEPLGEHNCIVCAGTACYVKGSAGHLPGHYGGIRHRIRRNDARRLIQPHDGALPGELRIGSRRRPGRRGARQRNPGRRHRPRQSYHRSVQG